MSFQEKLLKADINISASGDNTVITIGVGDMPSTWENGAVYIVIDHLNLLVNGTVTVQLKTGTVAEGQASYGGPYALSQGQAVVLENSARHQHGVITLPPNRSLVINLNAAVQVSGFIRYRLLATN